MGTALITIKIMPSSPDVNLDELQSNAESIIKDHQGEKPNTIKIRIGVYKKQTEPLIEYYKNKGNLIEIDAAPKINEIFSKLNIDKKNLEDYQNNLEREIEINNAEIRNKINELTENLFGIQNSFETEINIKI